MNEERGKEEEKKESKEQRKKVEEEDGQDGDFRISVAPLVSNSEYRPSISVHSQFDTPPVPERSICKAIIPFTGSFSVLQCLTAKPSIEASVGSRVFFRDSTEDRRTQSTAIDIPGLNRSDFRSAPPGLDQGLDKKGDGREQKKRSKNWTRSETLNLIGLRTELAPRFARTGRKSELWDEIARLMQKGPFNRDAQQCRDKWEKLMAGYKEVRDGLKHKDDYPYYDDLHPLLSAKVSKRTREHDASNELQSAETESLRAVLNMGASQSLSARQQYHPLRDVLDDSHCPQPCRAVLIDSHAFLTNLRMYGQHLHHAPWSLATMDGLPFRNLHMYARNRKSSPVAQHIPSANDDDGNEDHDDAFDKRGCKQKRRKMFEFLSTTNLCAIQDLLESAVAKQQIFFKELLDGIEKKEEIREIIREEREEKWRAEERAQHLFFAEAMQFLSQKLRADDGSAAPSAAGVKVPMCASDNFVARAPCFKKRSKNWKRSEVLQLIKIRGEMEERFAKSIRRAALWGELAEVLRSRGVRRDGKQCREKWEKLMSEYKDVVEGKKQKGDSPYFPELWAALMERGL
ncbi:hypothetical protein KP509_25G033700 [Ceratopteris richardii]|nr:hypothetical protein KP509_25G033700 [Ceratopteris richardii]